ncbi:ABC transporter substrate-binding protein [Candidatus Parabeggiatoa sp. HSG14]|uniref:ABC transporter substrate-binding protein n=1 Tax=Candidatus Parabeggiatoa sp. HSG14 TaxID=3055593 RepID=UPI0025A70F2D|nr:ABC transporter substrate-binding protein [Thiotrichales bacterium HSG14]
MLKQLLIFLITFSMLPGLFAKETLIYESLELRPDDAPSRAAQGLVKGSHIQVFLPSIPYVYISHAINGGLLRPANNTRGWEYELALSHRQISDITYEFILRKGVFFQDGTPFNADAVLRNMDAFTYQPYLTTKIHEVFDYAEKIDDYTVQFNLTQKYGMFLHDLIWIHFYTDKYLEKYGWNGKATLPNLAEPGPYGIGPYILTKGYIEGDRQTPKAELVANPNYWNKRYPKIERVTIYTELNSEHAKNRVLHEEGSLDITPIAVEHKIETILSPYAKLVISPSTNNYAIHFNMYNGHSKLKEKSVRLALNQALHQVNLRYFIFDDESQLSPTMVAPDFPGVQDAMLEIKPYSEISNPYSKVNQTRLKEILDGLHLKVLTQERFLFLWRGIEEQLNKVGVVLEIKILPDEKAIFAQLLTTEAGKNTKPWDLLIWGNDDWFNYHPWTAFLVYRTQNYWNSPFHWSSISPDSVLDDAIEELFTTAIGEPGYNNVVYKIMKHVYDNAYMLFVPTPNKVLAINKEVIFTPYKQAVLPLWEISITREHWSIREGDYPEELKQPVKIIRKNFKPN